MNRGAWKAVVHGVAKSWTRLSMHASLLYDGLIRHDFVGYLRQNGGIDWGIGTVMKLMVYLEQGI